MNTTENNKLIAEFIGLEILYRPYSNGFVEISGTEVCDVDDLKYNSSWDWLMPVLQRIKETQRNGNSHYTQLMNTTLAMAVNSGIESTYKNVVQFINWHNSQKTN